MLKKIRTSVEERNCTKCDGSRSVLTAEYYDINGNIVNLTVFNILQQKLILGDILFYFEINNVKFNKDSKAKRKSIRCKNCNGTGFEKHIVFNS